MNKKQYIFIILWSVAIAGLGIYGIIHYAESDEYKTQYAACESIDFDSEECFCLNVETTCSDTSFEGFIYMIIGTIIILGPAIIITEYLGDDED